MIDEKVDTEVFQQRERLRDLRVAHRDLDRVIRQLVGDPGADQLLVRRLKVQKLRLKDSISRLESALIPNLNA
jgi:hypothetical protein